MKSKTYFSQTLQRELLIKFFSKHKTFAAHFSLFSGTQFGKHCIYHRSVQVILIVVSCTRTIFQNRWEISCPPIFCLVRNRRIPLQAVV